MKSVYYEDGWGIIPDRLTLLLGSFDGLHLGHYELVKEAKKKASGDIGALLFSDNIASFLGHKSAKSLTSLEDKKRLFASYGFDYLFIIPLSKEFLALDKDSFLDKYIAPLSPSLLICGEDYSFGKRAEGKSDDLKKRFDASILPIKTMNGEKIGTQRIIALIEEGKIEEANARLGRDYEISGKVVRGLGNGHKIGFPTANLSLSSPYPLPPSGVYKTVSYLRGIPHLSLTNIGDNPTFGVSKERSIETYIPSFGGEIYGETLYLSFLSFIRKERKFKSVEELKKQIELDTFSLGNNEDKK